jgi:hypothetical protein
MRTPRLTGLACFLAMLLVAAGPSLVRAGSVTFNVTVDTSSLNGQSGYLDSQFNPGGSGAAAATASITGFTSDGALQPGAPLNGVSGDVSGALPGTLTLNNSTAFNDSFEGFTFGNTVRFALTLSGPAVGGAGAVGSAFAFSLFDVTGSIPLLTTDPNGSVLTINVNADGSTTVQTFPQSPNNPTPVATVSSVPEPSSLALSASVLAGLAIGRRKRAAKRGRSASSSLAA